MPAIPPRIDWFRVIADLNYRGYSNGRIAAEMLLSKNWVASLKNDGTEPRHVDGQMLLGLWSMVTGKPIGKAPAVYCHGTGARATNRFLGLKRNSRET